MKNIPKLALTLAASCFVSMGVEAQVYSPNTDFSPTENPHGIWSYGYSLTLGSPLILHATQASDAGTEGWRTDFGYGDPVVEHNSTSQDINYTGGVLHPGQLVMHPGQSDQISIVRFTAPTVARYRISGTYSGIDTATTDVHLLINGVSSFDGLIDGRGTSADFSAVVQLQVGDVVDFAVGYGINGNLYSDSTGLFASLVALNEAPHMRSLTLNQNTVGKLTTSDGIDQWNFAAAAGDQVQFVLVNGSAPQFRYDLIGPTGEIVFRGASSTSALLNLPVSGAYSLSVYSSDGTIGSYGFALNKTTILPLALGTPYSGTWVGSGQAQLYAVSVTESNPLSIVLEGPTASDHTEVYARFGSPPTRAIYDYSANGAGPNHSLLVPLATAGTWYVLVYGESIPAAPDAFTLKATASEVFLTGSSLTTTAPDVRTIFTVSGAGFSTGTLLQLIDANGQVAATATSLSNSSTQIMAEFSSGTLIGGTYTIRAKQPDGSLVPLPVHPVVVNPKGEGALAAHLEIPDPVGRHIASTFYIDYTNTGTAPMPAPLLILNATNPSGLHGAFMTLDASLQTSGFWTSATPAGYSQSVQVLASGATPGVLQPGETGRVPVYYAGWLTSQWDFNHPTLNFSLTSIKADDSTYVDWASKEVSLQPPGISTVAWHVIYAGLLHKLGATSGGYVKLLDDAATYLGQFPARAVSSPMANPWTIELEAAVIKDSPGISDIGRLWSFAVAQGENLWPLPSLGSVTDGSLPVTGALPMTFTRAFNNTVPGRFQAGILGTGWFTPWQQSLSKAADGTITVTNGSGARSIYQPDSRSVGKYFSQPGDTSSFTSVSGGYVLTAASGMITAFSSSGTLNYLQENNGNKITAGYTGGKLTSLTASSGQFFMLGYNGAELLSTLTDSAGRVTHYAYDASNLHLLSVTAYNGQVTIYTYNTTADVALNALTSIAFPDGTHQYFEYNSSGGLAITSADGGALKKTFTYSDGKVTTTDLLGNASSLFFNESGQLAKTVDALGNPTIYAYDTQFNLTQVINAGGASAYYGHNSVGEVTDAQDFLGHHTYFNYDGVHNQLSKLTDANGNPTQYSYNPSGSLLTTTYANGRTAISTYDPLGNALSFVNAASEAIQYAHNAAGQLTSAGFPDGSSYTYAYDAEGHLTAATDANGSVVFTYDPTTRFLTKVAYPNGLYLTFTYDAGGRRTSMADQTGFTTNYAYDAVGRLSTLKDGSGNTIVTYLYDAAGRLSKKTNGNGTYTTDDYDGNGHVLHLINYAPGGTINSRFDDTYNALGLKTAEATLDGTWTYTYDANGQLTHAVFASNNPVSVPNQDLAYNYDAMGNRTSTVINGVTTAYVVNNMNQYASVGGATYSYDAKGNLLSDGTNTVSYNVLNRVMSITTSSSNTVFGYNALDQRNSRIFGGTISYDLIDPIGTNMLGEFDSGGVNVTHYIYGLGLVDQSIGGAIYFHDFDDIGSTVGLSGSSGDYLSNYNYLPFGEVANSFETIANPYQFIGVLGVFRDIGGLSFMQKREYSYAAGQFLGNDPIGLAGQDTNLRRYVGNDPVSFVDPLGLWRSRGGSANFTSSDGYLHPENAERDIDRLLGPSGSGDPAGDNAHLGRGNEDDIPPALGPPGEAPAPILPGFPFPDPGINPPGSYPLPGIPLPPVSGTPNDSQDDETREAHDPNALYGPAGYGAANFVTNLGNTFAYRITYENDAAATAPAQSVTITNNLDAHLDWSTFQLTGIGFGDNNLVIPPGSQHTQTTISMTYNGQTFDVQMEAGLHSDTGQVYAIFQSIDPNTSLPPANVLTGFLPPEDGTGRGDGYLTYTVSPKANLATGTKISNVASIVFDAGVAITTDQVDPHDPSKGTDPTKQATVTIDSGRPTSQLAALATNSGPFIKLAWSGSDDAGGSGLAGYTIYVSTDGGITSHAILSNTLATSLTYAAAPWHTYTFYVVAKDNVGNTQMVDVTTQAQTTTVTIDDSKHYVALVPRQSDLNQGLGGMLSVAVMKTGAWTGSLHLGGNTYSAKGTVVHGSGQDPKIDASVSRGRKLTALHLVLTLGGDNAITGSLGDGTHSVALSGWRAIWDAKQNPATAYASYSTGAVRLDASGSSVGDVAIPQGIGYFKLTTTLAGTLKGGGKLSDGSAFSIGSYLGPNGEILVFTPLYSKTGSVQGLATLDTAGASSGNWTWLKDAQTKTSRSYPAGFGTASDPVKLTISGNRYTAPATNERLFAVGSATPNATIDFDDAGIDAAVTNPDADFTITAKNVANFAVVGSADNPASVKLTLDVKHGLFKGSFLLNDPDPEHAGKNLKRVITLEGALNSVTKQGEGFFLLPQLATPNATPPTTSKTSPILSGEVLVKPK